VIVNHGSHRQILTGGTYNNKVGTWSHDGKRIAFKSDRSGKWGIYVMNADGSTAKLVTQECDEFGRPEWSVDDSHIFYTATRDGATRIWVISTDGSGARPVE
jgi:Tol biopolymer transport system component